MRELAYWLGGFGAWSVTLWMIKRVIKTQIFDAIDESKHISERAEDAVIALSGQMSELRISITQSNAKLHEEILDQALKMSNLFTDCVSIARRAQSDAQESVGQISEMKQLWNPKRASIGVTRAKKNGTLNHKK